MPCLLKELIGQYSKQLQITFGNNFSDEGRLPGSVFLLGDFLLFFIVNACYEEKSSEREA